MKRLSFTLRVVTLAVFTVAFASIAQAQATRTWVSGVGDDVNPCSRTAPCKTWAGAISKTAANGEIDALDPGGFGALTITKSITVSGRGTNASALNAGLNGFTINFTNFGADVRKSVRIRDLTTQGADSGTGGIRIIGSAAMSPNSEVLIENVTIDGNNAGNGRGVSDERDGGGELYMNNVTISNQSGTGVSITPATTANTIHASLNDVRIYNCNFGVAIGNGTRATLNNVTAVGNTSAGFFAEGALGGSEMTILFSTSASNGTGVQANAGGTIRTANSSYMFNATAVSGTVNSYGNNTVSGGAGSLTLLAGGDTLDNGQQ